MTSPTTKLKPCEECKWFKIEEFGFWCEQLNTRIFGINSSQPGLFCDPDRPKYEIYKINRKVVKYRTLAQVFKALGAPHGDNHKEKKRKEKSFTGGLTVLRHLDGSYKNKRELITELKDLFKVAITIYHPDKNNYEMKRYYDEESKEILGAYNRGLEIIKRKFTL